MKSSNVQKGIPLISLVTYIIMIVTNALANILPINGKGTGEISDFYANLFAPAGYTFAIWGLIYLLLLTYTVYQLSFHQAKDDNKKQLIKTINIAFIISSLANAFWILAWHYDYIFISLVLMLIILICLIRINLALRKKELSIWQKLFIRLPFSVYFGWITVATVANVTTLLVSLEWDGFGLADYFWTDIIIIIAAIIGFAATLYYQDVAYASVIIWAYIGILVKHLSTAGFDGEYVSVIVSIVVSMLLILTAIVLVIQIKLKKKKYSH